VHISAIAFAAPGELSADFACRAFGVARAALMNETY
jgi:hypothetical protein